MRNRYYEGPRSDHFDGLRFFNPGEAETDRSLLDLARWKVTGKAARWPTRVPVRPAVPEARVAGLRVTMVGHASLLVQAGGLNVLTDPVWSERVSPSRHVGPRRVSDPGIAFDALPRIDIVLVSHNHYDHMDLDTLARLHARDAPLVVTPLGNDTILREAVPGICVETGDWGARFALAEGAEVAIVPANHWSARFLRDKRMALWGGFMLRTRAGLVYVAGDTAYGTGRIFRAMHAEHGAPDVALLPIGAYAPRWFLEAQHCDPTGAIAIFRDLEARLGVGMHWGTFQLTDEPREEPAELLRECLARNGIAPGRFVAAKPGDVIDAR